MAGLLDAEAMTALGASPRDNVSAAGFSHAVSEAVDALTAPHLRLIGSLGHNR